MSNFKSTAAHLKQQLLAADCNQHTHQQPKGTLTYTAREELACQQPIIIEKRTVRVPQPNKNKTTAPLKKQASEIIVPSRKTVDAFVPVVIPVRQKKINMENVGVPQETKKEIEICVESDNDNRDCLKKLFKKVHKLEKDLQTSEAQNTRLRANAEEIGSLSKKCSEAQKKVAKLEGENYKLQVDLDMTRQLLKPKDDKIASLKQTISVLSTKLDAKPKEIVKEVIVQKLVQVPVEVIKCVPGPEVIVEKIVEVPKYIEVEKKVPYEVVREVEVVRRVEVPTIVEKPVYIDKPIYIDRPPIQIEKRVEVPVEYPVYVDRPVVEEEWISRMQHLELEMEQLMRENAELAHENGELRVSQQQLNSNIEILRKHNAEKNRQVELLVQRSVDYNDVAAYLSPYQEPSLGSANYSISSNPHRRII